MYSLAQQSTFTKTTLPAYRYIGGPWPVVVVGHEFLSLSLSLAVSSIHPVLSVTCLGRDGGHLFAKIVHLGRFIRVGGFFPRVHRHDLGIGARGPRGDE